MEKPTSIGIIGYGAFGSFVHELIRHYAPDIAVKVYSKRFSPAGNTPEDMPDTFFALEEVCASDVVVLAVPIRAYEETLRTIVPHLLSKTILVDVATVKEHTVSVLKSLAPEQPFIATHPMFGPYSYLKKHRSLEGLRLVITEHSLQESAYTNLKKFLESIGLVILEMTPNEHDRMLAETLFLTHYIGQIVTEGDFRRTTIDTVSFGFLMDAVESVQNDTELFKDVYRYNPHCKEVVARFEQSETAVERLLGKE